MKSLQKVLMTENLQVVARVNERQKARSPASEIAWKLFGGTTTYRESLVIVGTSGTEIVKNDPNRIFLYISNTASNNGTVRFSPEITSGIGVPLTPTGGYASWSIREDGDATIQAVYGVAAVAGSVWYVYEVVRVGRGRWPKQARAE